MSTYVHIEADLFDKAMENLRRVETRRGCNNESAGARAMLEHLRTLQDYADSEPSTPYVVEWKTDAERRHLRRKAEEALRKADDVRLALALKTLEVVLGVRIL